MVLKMVRNIPERLRSGLSSTAELHTRIEELDKLKDQMKAVEMSTTSAVSNGILILKHDTNPFPSGNVYSRPKC